MKYSFVFCYRNRPEHLAITIPRIRELYPDAEIIVAEQADDKKFRRANLLNEGARIATGDILVLHDIDYYPKDVVYYDSGHNDFAHGPDVYLPVHRVVFMYNHLEEKPIEEVPGGYRHFRDAVDSNFFGGVITFKKESFMKINGFSPDYIGWGFEDADLRGRVYINHLKVIRTPKESGLFWALDHVDSGPAQGDPDFQRNIEMASSPLAFAHRGINNCHPAKIEECDLSPEHAALGITKWIRCSEFDAPPPAHHSVTASEIEPMDIQI